MLTELHLLHAFLVLAFALGPLLNRWFFLRPDRAYRILHPVAFALTTAALLLDIPWLTGAWPAYCVYGLGLFLKQHFLEERRALSLSVFAQTVPLLFSVVAAGWLFGGANDLRLLGYGRHFSYYAALHSNFLGWLLIGCIAALQRHEPRRSAYLACVGVCFVSFALIAYGIDGVPYIKVAGVAGLTLALSVAYGLFLSASRGLARALGLVSLLGLVATMTLAWQNEVGALAIKSLLGVRSMVSVHGLLNAALVVPTFFAAVALHLRRRRGPT